MKWLLIFLLFLLRKFWTYFSKVSGVICLCINCTGTFLSTSCADELLPNQAEFENAFTSTGFRTPTPLQYTSFSSQLNSRGNIDTKREAAMFLAHVLYESNGLRYKEEARCESEEGLKKCIQDYALTGGIQFKSFFTFSLFFFLINIFCY